MPIYEFECCDCRVRTSIFVRTVSSGIDEVCPSCGGKLTRLVSRFGVTRSARSVHERYSNPSDPGYYSDPRNIGRGVEERFASMGMEIPNQIRSSIDAAREGVMPDSVKDLQPNVTEL